MDRRRSIILLFPRTLHHDICMRACMARGWEGKGKRIGSTIVRSIHRSEIRRSSRPIVSRVTGVYRGEAARFLFPVRISAFSPPPLAIFRIYAMRFLHRSARASYRLAGFRPRRTSPPLALSSSCESRVPRVSRDRIRSTTRETARVKP